MAKRRLRKPKAVREPKAPRDPEEAARARESRLKTVFNICSEEYEAVLAYQNGVCPITGQTSRLFVIDHDHADGRVRGILDWQVNKGLAYFKDNPHWLRRAADYLENNPVTAALGEEVYGVMGKVTKLSKNRVYGPHRTKTPHPRSESSLFRKRHPAPKPRVVNLSGLSPKPKKKSTKKKVN